MREKLSNRATIKCQVSHMVSYTWALIDCFPLRLPSYIYRRNAGVTCIFHEFKSCSFEGDFFYVIFDCVFCRVSLRSICRHTRRLFAKTNGSVWADDHLVSSSVENKCDSWDLADAYCLNGDDNRSHCLTPFW
jgi:hypothetical protein